MGENWTVAKLHNKNSCMGIENQLRQVEARHKCNKCNNKIKMKVKFQVISYGMIAMVTVMLFKNWNLTNKNIKTHLVKFSKCTDTTWIDKHTLLFNLETVLCKEMASISSMVQFVNNKQKCLKLIDHMKVKPLLISKTNQL